MWAHVGRARHGPDRVVHDPSDRSRIQPPTPRTQEKRRLRPVRDELRPAVVLPAPHSPFGRYAERHGPFPLTLTEDTDDSAGVVDIVYVKSTQFRHPHTGCIQQFQHSPITQRYRIPLLGTDTSSGKRRSRLIGPQHSRQDPTMPRRHQPQPRINSKQPGPSSPGCKTPSSSSPPSQRPTAGTPAEQRRKPGPHHTKIKATQAGATPSDLGQMLQQRDNIPDVGPNGMHRQATLQRQMPLKVINRPPQHSRQSPSRAKQAGPHRLRVRHREHTAPALWRGQASPRKDNNPAPPTQVPEIAQLPIRIHPPN